MLLQHGGAAPVRPERALTHHLSRLLADFVRMHRSMSSVVYRGRKPHNVKGVRSASAGENAMKAVSILLCAATFTFITPATAEDTLKIAIPQRGAWDTSISEIGQKAGIFKKHG